MKFQQMVQTIGTTTKKRMMETAILLYGREGADTLADEEPESSNEQDEDGNKYVPVLMFS